MPPTRGQKRKSDQKTASTADDVAHPETAMQRVATKTGDEAEQSPAKRQKTGLTLVKKQQLIDNLQQEVATRARKLRADYNGHIRHLRFRIETRANRIPPALLKMKMGALLEKRSVEEQQKATAPAPAPSAVRPPPVPPKDAPAPRPVLQRTAQGSAPAPAPARVAKRTSEDISGGDKENEMAHIDNPKKKARANPAGAATRPHPNPSQVLSPTSPNSRVLPPRERAAAPAPSPGRSFIARPVSPTKQPSTTTTSNSGMFSSMVEKARSTTRAAATTRKTTTSSAAPAPATRTRKGAATATAPASRAAAVSRTTRRVSAISESSDGSTGTVVRKRTTTAAATAAPAAKRTVMGTIRKGVAGAAAKKAPAAKKAAPAAPGTGRVLRKRN